MSATIAREAPADAASLARALADASRARHTVRVIGADTKRYLGEIRPTDLDLVTERISGVIDHVPADLTVTVAGGTPLSDVVATLARAGQFLPLDPPHGDRATIGGIIAASSAGFWRTRYGAVRDLLIGTRTALADGTVVGSGGRVVKNVAGYDMNKLLVGSFGTLGVIVEATLKVLPLPVATAELSARYARGTDAFAAAATSALGAARPSAVVVERSSGGWSVVVEARGDRAVVERVMADAERAATDNGAHAERREGRLGELRELPARAIDGALIRVALPLAAQAAFADTATRVETFHTLVADAASGIMRTHLAGADDDVVRDADALLLAARAVGGNGRVERRADTLIPRLAAWPSEPKGHFLMRRIKDAFDPAGVLEPGRSAV